MKNFITIFLILLFIINNSDSYAQNIDLENAMQGFRNKIKEGKKLKISGGLNLSTVYTKSNSGNMRDPFVYQMGGSINLSFMKISIPISYNFTNAGFSYSYQYPRLPSRLSLHPKYKNFQAHIGDFSMNFSPYTMSGFQLVGGGIDYKFKKEITANVFYGRFQKPVEFNPSNGNNLANYGRKGFGVKISKNAKKNQFAISIIKISDKLNSLARKPDSLNIFPKSNLAFSIDNKFKLVKNLSFDIEFGLSFLTNDIRAKKDSIQPGFVKFVNNFTNSNASTNIYKAVKTSLNYTIGSTNFGVGVERIDPSYQTLGAYYFTNDFENITLSLAQQLFKNKLNLSYTGGIQRDDLKGEKTGSNRRIVTAVNASLNASKSFTTTFSYSNFQSFTNVKQQFQLISQLTPFENLDTLNFRQLSQNATASFNIILNASKEISKLLNINLSFQDSYDEQGGVIARGNSSQFFNLAMSYTLSKIPKNLNISGGLNGTYNTIGLNESITFGPTINIGKMYFKKKLRTNLTGAYNVAMQKKDIQQQIYNFRINGSYTLLKKHQLSLNFNYMNRKLKLISNNDFSSTFTYSYSF